jgi:hypothetical protein
MTRNPSIGGLFGSLLAFIATVAPAPVFALPSMPRRVRPWQQVRVSPALREEIRVHNAAIDEKKRPKRAKRARQLARRGY